MPKTYSENEKEIIYGYYVLCPEMTIAEISKKLLSHNIPIKSKTLSWLMDSWGWNLHRKLSKYLNISYPFLDRHHVERLPSSVLDKVSRENIKKINAKKRKNYQNRKYRNGLKSGNLIQKVEVIDITSGNQKDFKAVSEIVETSHETEHKSPHMPTIAGQVLGQHTMFSPEEELGYEKLKKQLFSYNKLNHSIERLMSEIVTQEIDENNKVTLLEKFSEVFERLNNEGLLVKRQQLIQMRQHDLSVEQIEQARVHKSLAYNFVNQGLRDEYLYGQGIVREIDFKDANGNPAMGVITWDEKFQDGAGGKVGDRIKSKPARLSGKHLSVMGMLRTQVNATQINNNIQMPELKTSAQNEIDNDKGLSIEELEKKSQESHKLINIIKDAEKKLPTERLEDCDENCAKCHIKMSCNDSTLRNGIQNNE